MEIAVSIPDELRGRASRWAELKRWERRELGQELRRLGLSYREIASVIPVAKGTLAGWCRDIDLAPEFMYQLRARRPELGALRAAGLRRRQRTAADATAAIRAARLQEPRLSADPRWTAGIVAYWAEGAKRPRPELRFSNSDPGLVVLFLEWARDYLELSANPFVAQLHLHDGQDEQERRVYWSLATGIPLSEFRKSYIKREGTGHRKNVLYNGTISIRVRRSSAHFYRVMGWIEGLKHVWAASSTG